jgi:hypothetical protein
MPWGMLLAVSPCGNGTNSRGQLRELYFRKWKPDGKPLFDLGFAPVCGHFDLLIDIFWREMRFKETQRGQVKAPFCKGGEERRESPGRPCGMDALRG